MEELIELINICSTKVKSDDEEISMQVEHDMENMNRKVTSPKAISLQEVDKGEFDQPKDDNDQADILPFRHLKYWYIYKKNDRNQRISATDVTDSIIKKGCTIAGWVQPSPSSSAKPAYIALEKIEPPVVDYSKKTRGYWVKSNRGNKQSSWYWLQVPCDVLPSPEHKSQSDVQFDAVIILSCISLIVDQVLIYEDNSRRSITDIINESPLLQTPNNDTFTANVLSRFELNIIALHKKYLEKKLLNYIPSCTKDCTFIKSLSKLKSTYHPSKQALKLWNEYVLEQLAQQSWGGAKESKKRKFHDLSQTNIEEKDPTSYSGKKMYSVVKRLPWKHYLSDAMTSITHNDYMKLSWIELSSKMDLKPATKDEEKKSFFGLCLGASDAPIEETLLLINCLCNSPSYWSHLYRKNKTSGNIPATKIYNHLKDRALDELRELVNECKEINETIPMYILCSILLLLGNCNLITKAKLLTKMKEETDVDWDDCLKKVDDFFTILGNHNIPEYLLACHQKAKGKLASIIVESKGTGEPKGSGKLNESSERKESYKSSNGRGFSNEKETRDKRNVITTGGKFEKSNVQDTENNTTIPKKNKNSQANDSKNCITANNFNKSTNGTKSAFSLNNMMKKMPVQAENKTAVIPKKVTYTMATIVRKEDSIAPNNSFGNVPKLSSWDSHMYCGWGDLIEVLPALQFKP